MIVNVSNIRGIAEFAEIDIGDPGKKKTTFVFGGNGAGKTSLIQAVAAILTGESLPRGVLKKNAAAIIADGAKSAMISTDGRTIKYPSCEVTGASPVSVCPHAAGLENIATMPMQDRVRLISEQLHAEPTEADLLKEIARCIPDMTPDAAKKLWAAMSVNGFDLVHKSAKEKGARMKGQWEQITGERWGDSKAQGWTPPMWTNELETTDPAQLAESVRVAEAELEGAIAHDAVTGEKTNAMKAETDKLPGLIVALAKAAEKMTDVTARREALAAKLSELPPGEVPPAYCCPKCKTALRVVSGALTAVDAPPNAEELKKRREAIADINAGLAACSGELDATKKEIGALECQIKLAEKIGEEMASMKPGETADTAETAEKIDTADCRRRLTLATGRLAAIRQRTDADKIRDQVFQNAEIVRILDTPGLRKSCLVAALERLNSRVAGGVVVTDELEIEMCCRPYWLLSESEKWRARTYIQIALAEINGDQYVVLDGLDICMKAARNEVIGVVLKSPVSAVVGCSLSSREEVPAVGKVGAFACWVEGGRVVMV